MQERVMIVFVKIILLFEIFQIKDVKKVDSLKAINHYFNIAGYKDQGC